MVHEWLIETVRHLETTSIVYYSVVPTIVQKIALDGKIINPTFAKRNLISYRRYRDSKWNRLMFLYYYKCI